MISAPSALPSGQRLACTTTAIMGKKKRSSVENGGSAAPPSGRSYTVSMAIPGSIIENTQNLEHATFVAGQIARTAAIFNVDEVVVFDDSLDLSPDAISSGAAFLARVIQFMETPQYLRRELIPMHPDLRLAGILPPLDAPHHLRATEWQPYRYDVLRCTWVPRRIVQPPAVFGHKILQY